MASDADLTRLMEWVAVCAPLHSVCIRLGDTSPEVAVVAADVANAAPGSAVSLPAAASAARSRVQQKVFQYMFAHGRYHW